MSKVMITGSFDPVTIGHEDIIRRASMCFESVRVTVFINPEKPGMFSPDTRVSFLKRVCAKFSNVTVDFDDGMVVDYVKREGITLLLRAVRDERDLAYEMQMADYNRAHSGVETVFFAASPSLARISSSEVRKRIAQNVPYDILLPEEIRAEIAENIKKRSLK